MAGRRLGLDAPQSIVEVGDQVLGLFHTDRNANQIVADAKRRLALVGYRQMGHRGGGRCKGLGTAEADRQIGDLQRVEEGKGFALAALQVEREGRSRAGAMAPVDISLARSLLQKSEIADALDLRVVAQEGADLARRFRRRGSILSSSVSRLRISIQAVFGSQMPPMTLRINRTLSSSARLPTRPPATRSLWPPAYLVRL